MRLTRTLLAGVQKLATKPKSTTAATLFLEEKSRQLGNIARIEKVVVKVKSGPEQEPIHLAMNLGISTPFDCAMHISEQATSHAALALVNGQPWDMHSPLTTSELVTPESESESTSETVTPNDDPLEMELEFKYFTDRNPNLTNKAYWRSCSYLLGAVLRTALKPEFNVQLHSWPAIDFSRGSFVHDFTVNLDDWTPTTDELRILSRLTYSRLKNDHHRFEPLDVYLPNAERILQDFPLKLAQLPSIARSNKKLKDHVRLYRMGDHVDVSFGPFIASTAQIGYFAVTRMPPMPGLEVAMRWAGRFELVGVAQPADWHGSERVESRSTSTITRTRIDDD